MENENIQLICIFILFYFIYALCISESLIDFKIKDKSFKVYNTLEDYETAGELLYKLDESINKLLEHLDKKYIQSDKHQISDKLKKRLKRLINGYKTDHLKENFPKDYDMYGKKPDSSYTLDKLKMAICLRNKQTKEFHNINDIMFVLIHELGHILSPEWGHTELYWKYFKFLLHESVEIGIYHPIDYRHYNVKYCNTELKANPYFSKFNCTKGIPHTCDK